MAVENSTEQLVERIRRDAKVPKGSTYWDAATLLGMADAETRSLVVRHVAGAVGEYLVRYVDMPLVPGKRAYRQPSRAIRLKEVERYDADGNPRPFGAVDSAQARDWKGSGRHYYFEDNAFVPVLEDDATGGFFRVRYYRWPAQLVLPEACGRFDGVDEDDGIAYVLLLTAPDDFYPASPAFVPFDLVKGSTPFETLVENLRLEMPSTPGDTVNLRHVDLPDPTFSPYTDMESGVDYLCRPGTTCFPQLPLIFHDPLVELVAARVQREMKDVQGAAVTKASADEKLAAAVALTSPRAKSEKAVVGSPWLHRGSWGGVRW